MFQQSVFWKNKCVFFFAVFLEKYDPVSKSLHKVLFFGQGVNQYVKISIPSEVFLLFFQEYHINLSV